MKIHNIGIFKPGNLNLIGGGERVLVILANFLSNYYNVTIFTYSSKKSYYALNDNVNIIKLNLEKSKYDLLNIVKPLFYLKRAKQLAIRNNIETMIAFSDIGAVFVFLAFNNKQNIRKIAWLHNSYYQPINFIISKIRISILKHFDKIVVLNQMDMKIYNTKIKKQNVVHIPNPLPFTLNLSSNLTEKKIITVGRLHKDKGLEHLLEIAKHIYKYRKDWKWELIGQDRNYKQYLKEKIKQQNLEDFLIIKNPTNQIEDELLNASIFALTSLYEAFGLVLIEASMAGLPLIAFNSPGGIRDIIKDDINGFLIKPYDKMEFTKKLLNLIDSYELRKDMGQKARDEVSRYHPSVISKQWIKLLEKE